MIKSILILSIPFYLFAAFSQSTNYQLKSYAIGPGGSSNSSSTKYNLQASVGEQTNGSTKSPNNIAGNGSIQTEQLNLPLAPTLSNNSGQDYSNLLCIINIGNNPTDSIYSVAVSSDNFSTTSFVQADGTLGSSPLYQSYTAWGSSLGFNIVGLTPNTQYEVKVSVMQGKFTNTEYGPYSTASTASLTLAFSISSNSTTVPAIIPGGSIVVSPTLIFNYSTNALSGGSIYMIGKNDGFYSPSLNYKIPSYTGNLASQSQGFGIQFSNAIQVTGGPFNIDASFNVSGNNIMAETSNYQQVLYSSSAINGAQADADIQVRANKTAPPANDYTEVLIFTAVANY